MMSRELHHLQGVSAAENASNKVPSPEASYAEASSPGHLVAFLGPVASYTYTATQSIFPESSAFIHYPCPTISGAPPPLPSIPNPSDFPSAVFKALQSGTSSLGVVPYENSTNGAVPQTLDLLSLGALDFPDVQIIGEAFVAVHHSLLGYSHGVPFSPTDSGRATPTSSLPTPKRPKTIPLTDLTHVHTLISHPQAWTQCEAFLGTYLKGRARQDASSTAQAAALAAADESGRSAAIAAHAAAVDHGLDALANGIEDRVDNCTRFLVLRRLGHSLLSMHLPSWLDQSCPRDPKERYRSLVCFTVQDGARKLGDVLSLFRSYQIEVVNVQSRPSRHVAWHYVFFVELVGRKGDASLEQAFARLKGIAFYARWLGSFRERSRIVV